MSALIGLKTPAAVGTTVVVRDSPFDSAPAYVGLVGTIVAVISQWEPEPGVFRTQYRVEMRPETNDNNKRILSNPPTGPLGPLWAAEGPYSFIMLDHELETFKAPTGVDAQITVQITIDGVRREYDLDPLGIGESGLNQSMGDEVSVAIIEAMQAALWDADGESKIEGLSSDHDYA
jgi:hypothetical protein